MCVYRLLPSVLGDAMVTVGATTCRPVLEWNKGVDEGTFVQDVSQGPVVFEEIRCVVLTQFSQVKTLYRPCGTNRTIG